MPFMEEERLAAKHFKPAEPSGHTENVVGTRKCKETGEGN